MTRLLPSIGLTLAVASLGALSEGCTGGEPAAHAATPARSDGRSEKARPHAVADGGAPDAKGAWSPDAGRGGGRKHHRTQGPSVKPPEIGPTRACGAVYCDSEGNCDAPSPPNCKP